MQPHIQIKKTMINTRYAILPGDPKRIDHIAQYLDNVTPLANNREYRSIKGTYHGIEVVAISTGIGGPSMAVAVHELANIGIDTLIRIGSCGAVQSHLKLGELVIPHASVREDGASKMYIDSSYPAAPDPSLFITIAKQAQLDNLSCHLGMNRSHDSFYTEFEDELTQKWKKANVISADMETSTLFVLGSLLGLKTASILNVVVTLNENLDNAINDYVNQNTDCFTGEKNEILLSLNSLVAHSLLTHY